MRSSAHLVAAAAFVLLVSASSVSANLSVEEEVALEAREVEPGSGFAVVNQGEVRLVQGRRMLLVEEPAPVTILDEAPPAPLTTRSRQPSQPFPGAVWVPGHWSFEAGDFFWIEGRHIAPVAGHVFVPPRWVFVDQQHLFFTGFFVPFGVIVRSHFGRFFLSGQPTVVQRGTVPGTAARRDRGPYWPVGASGSPTTAFRGARGRGPYWPVGLGRPAPSPRPAPTLRRR